MKEKVKGKIFAIEEFSTFDGPGVRLTVFLKGCPLRCMWCHNPEGQSFDTEIVRSPNGCIGCNACFEAGKSQTGIPCLIEKSIAVCPKNIVRVCGKDILSEELLVILEKKLDMLNTCGGGITFSGGEPLAQHKFLKECLSLLRGKTNRAIQTSGFCENEIFSDIISECDYVLYDLKLMDPVLHEKYTGYTNERILKNYITLAQSGVDFITRIPLIPTVNDTVENITATAEFLVKNKAKKIELLSYNKSAGAKYTLVGKEYKTDFDQNRSPEPHIEIFSNYGIEVKIL